MLANSLKVTAPMMPDPTAKPTTGRIEVILVFTDRINT